MHDDNYDDLDNHEQEDRLLLADIRSTNAPAKPDSARGHALQNLRDGDPGSHPARMRRAAWKQHEVMHLLAHHDYTTTRVLSNALGLSLTRTRTEIRKWSRRGLLRVHTLPASNRRLIMLTRTGAIEACSTLGITRNPITDLSRIGRTLIDHTLAAQHAAIQWSFELAERPALHELTQYLVEPQYHNQFRPDMVVAADDSDEATIIEVELSRKSPGRLRAKVEQIAGRLTQSSTIFEHAIYIAPEGQVANGLRRAIDAVVGNYEYLAPAANRIRVECPDWLQRPL